MNKACWDCGRYLQYATNTRLDETANFIDSLYMNFAKINTELKIVCFFGLDFCY